MPRPIWVSGSSLPANIGTVPSVRSMRIPRTAFGLYVDGNDVVRFHCFGECKGDWDIYDVIHVAGKVFVPAGSTDMGGLSGIEGCGISSRARSENVPEPDAEPEPDDSVELSGAGRTR